MKLYKNIFLLFSLVFLIACKSLIAQSNKAIELKEKPNFIFYLADDQDQLDYGAYGNPKVSTFHVDKLAAQGMKFTNFYAAQAICAPARSQIFTGMYPVKNGCMANHIGVKPQIKSVATLLKKAGYEVVLAGKSHVKPNTVFNWTHYFENIDHRYLPLDKIDNYSCWKYLLFKKIRTVGQVVSIETLSNTYNISEYIKDFEKNTIYYRRKHIIDNLLNI